ncbi:hypothetical protein [Streptomyces lycii]|uniref:Uncharacterized protein n=1 Tax=Streptomyces lycii TaxID=2654337 RepID=A0ABQ7FHZ0_9ACTN|nr:hypothetical protein [Streptomyces lycii]KAF4408611.1 hypothetical protein GCU69_13000 [Streptomyces lycii]
MTLGELRRLLNTLPLEADAMPILIVDADTAQTFDIVTDRVEVARDTVHIPIELSE